MYIASHRGAPGTREGPCKCITYSERETAANHDGRMSTQLTKESCHAHSRLKTILAPCPDRPVMCGHASDGIRRRRSIDRSQRSPPPVSSVSIPVQTDDGWVPASLVEVGPAEQPLVDALNRIRRGEFNEIHGFVIIRTGKIVLEE